MEVYKLNLPTSISVPVLISVPHAGYLIPEEVEGQYQNKLIEFIDDTDWFVEKLYDFAPSMGIGIIHSVYSRWVIDLNRALSDKPLYNDGRIITGLIPTSDFMGRPLYKVKSPDKEEINRRINLYYLPYHDMLKNQLDRLYKQFGKVLLFEAHSIRNSVPSIHPDPFPDYILGDNLGKSAGISITQSALGTLKKCNKTVAHNFLFKGGYNTRHYGKPKAGFHAIQLEMTKTNYMDDSQINYHNLRANQTREDLKKMFDALISDLMA